MPTCRCDGGRNRLRVDVLAFFSGREQGSTCGHNEPVEARRRNVHVTPPLNQETPHLGVAIARHAERSLFRGARSARQPSTSLRCPGARPSLESLPHTAHDRAEISLGYWERPSRTIPGPPRRGSPNRCGAMLKCRWATRSPNTFTYTRSALLSCPITEVTRARVDPSVSASDPSRSVMYGMCRRGSR